MMLWHDLTHYRHRASPIVLGIVFLLTGVSFARLWQFDMKPAASALAPQQWPAGSALQLAPGAPRLLLFAHPLCSCTAASLHELARLLADEPSLTAQVVVTLLGSSAETVEALRRRVADLPRTEFVADPGGRETHRFGARSSGQVLLFSRAGKLLFSGGITRSRGHEGENSGEWILRQTLHAETRPSINSFPVFGCAFEESTR